MKTIKQFYFAVIPVIFLLFVLSSCGDESNETPETTKFETPNSVVEKSDTVQVQENEIVPAKEKNAAAEKRNDEFLSIPETYEVKDGDTLTTIAEKFYGDSSRWFEIFAANEGEINNWNNIYPGQTIKLIPLSTEM